MSFSFSVSAPALGVTGGVSVSLSAAALNPKP